MEDLCGLRSLLSGASAIVGRSGVAGLLASLTFCKKPRRAIEDQAENGLPGSRLQESS